MKLPVDNRFSAWYTLLVNKNHSYLLTTLKEGDGMEVTGKNFRKRNAILEYLRGTKAHPSAETVHADLKQQIPDLSMGTVYRNLNLFRQQGKISVIATVHGVERFDANTDPHVHFICSGCDKVIDLVQMNIPPELTNRAAQESGGQVETCSLSFTGLCSQCNHQ